MFALMQADITKKDGLGRQCLHLVAEAGCTESARYLSQQHGFDVNIQSLISGVTPLHLAAKVIFLDIPMKTV